MLLGSADRRQVSKQTCVPLWQDYVLRQSSRSQENSNWTCERMELSHANGLGWPRAFLLDSGHPCRCDYMVFFFADCLPREMDALFFISTVFDPQSDLECCDINAVLDRGASPLWKTWWARRFLAKVLGRLPRRLRLGAGRLLRRSTESWSSGVAALMKALSNCASTISRHCKRTRIHVKCRQRNREPATNDSQQQLLLYFDNGRPRRRSGASAA